MRGTATSTSGSAGQVDKLSDAADLNGLFAHIGRLDHQFDFSFDRTSAFHQLEGTGRRGRGRRTDKTSPGRICNAERRALAHNGPIVVILSVILFI